jgi:hypothetical protein
VRLVLDSQGRTSLSGRRLTRASHDVRARARTRTRRSSACRFGRCSPAESSATACATTRRRSVSVALEFPRFGGHHEGSSGASPKPRSRRSPTRSGDTQSTPRPACEPAGFDGDRALCGPPIPRRHAPAGSHHTRLIIRPTAPRTSRRAHILSTSLTPSTRSSTAPIPTV